MAAIKPIFYILIFAIICLKVSLFYASPLFTEESYSVLRQTQHIQENYIPYFIDSQTLQMQQTFVVPALAYVYAAFGFRSPSTAHMIIIALSTLASCFAFLGVARYHTQNTMVQWLSLAFFAAIPLSFAQVLHTVQAEILMVPLLLLLTYVSLLVRKQKISPWVALIIGVLCLVIHPITLVWIIGYLVFLLICWVEHLKTGKQEREFIVLLGFSAIVWASVLFAELLAIHRFSLLWKNIPLIHQINQPFDVLTTVTSIGIVPLALTTFALFIYSRGKRSKDILLYIALMITFLALSVATFTTPTTALLYFSIFMCCCLPYAIEQTRNYLEQTKFTFLTRSLTGILAVLLVLVSILPAAFTTIDFQASGLKEQSFADFPKNQIILTDPTIAHQLIYHTNSTVILHDDFLFNTQAQGDIELLQSLFQSRINTDKLLFLNKYDISEGFVYLHNTSHTIYAPNYKSFEDNSCFTPTNREHLYKISCSLVVS